MKFVNNTQIPTPIDKCDTSQMECEVNTEDVQPLAWFVAAEMASMF